MPDDPPDPPQLEPGGFGAGGVAAFSAGFGGEGGALCDGAEPLEPVGVAGRGAMLGAGAGRGGGGAAGRGAMLGAGAAGRGGAAAAAGAGAGAAALRGAAFFTAFFFATALRAVLRRAGVAFRVARFFAPALRRLAVDLARRFAVLRVDALRRFAVFLVERDAFLRPDRFDFDLDPLRAIKPPVFGLDVAVFGAAFATLYQHARRDEFRKGDSNGNSDVASSNPTKC